VSSSTSRSSFATSGVLEKHGMFRHFHALRLVCDTAALRRLSANRIRTERTPNYFDERRFEAGLNYPP